MSDFSLRNELHKLEDVSYFDYVDQQAMKKAYEKAEEVLNSLIKSIKFYEYSYKSKIISLKFVFVFNEKGPNEISLLVYLKNSKQTFNDYLRFDEFEGFDTVKVMNAIEDILAKDYEIKKINDKWFGCHEIAKTFSIEL